MRFGFSCCSETIKCNGFYHKLLRKVLKSFRPWTALHSFQRRWISNNKLHFLIYIYTIVAYHNICSEIPALRKPPGTKPTLLHPAVFKDKEPPQELPRCCWALSPPTAQGCCLPQLLTFTHSVCSWAPIRAGAAVCYQNQVGFCLHKAWLPSACSCAKQSPWCLQEVKCWWEASCLRRGALRPCWVCKESLIIFHSI